MKFIEKKYYTFTELGERWKCTQEDLVQAVIDGELVTSLHIPYGAYSLNRFTPADYRSSDLYCFPSQMYDYQNDRIDNEIRHGLTGFYYLILPKRTGALRCDFKYFAGTPCCFDDGDFCYLLETPVDIDHVLESGVVMADEVTRVEAKSNLKPGPDSVDKPLSTAERSTLLKLVIGMAMKGYSYDPEASKSPVPKEIADDLAGLGIAITDDTVRKYLNQAAKGVLPAKQR